MSTKFKIFWAALAAFVLGVFAFIIGRKTPFVHLAEFRVNRLKADAAKEELRHLQEQEHVAGYQAVASLSRAAMHVREIQKLDVAAVRSVDKIRSLGALDDQDFAHQFNRRVASR